MMSSNNWQNREQIPFWINYRGIIPETAIKGGFEDGEVLYIGRAMHNGANTPGKVLQSQKSCYISWGYKEHEKKKFEILVGAEGSWVSTKTDKIPKNAFPAGTSEQGDTLNIGRVNYENSVIVGKIHWRYKTCYIPYKGKEIEFWECEILIA